MKPRIPSLAEYTADKSTQKETTEEFQAPKEKTQEIEESTKKHDECYTDITDVIHGYIADIPKEEIADMLKIIENEVRKGLHD